MSGIVIVKEYEKRVVDTFKFKRFGRFDTALILTEPPETRLLSANGKHLATIPGALSLDQLMAILELVEREVSGAFADGKNFRSIQILDLLKGKE
jgi:hypothetical protein